MNSSSTFKWSLAVVLLLSITWKIAFPPDNQNPQKDGLVKFFERNKFDVALTEPIVNGAPIIRANTASCHLQIASLRPDGSDRDLFRHLITGTDRLFVVFRGRVYTQQPILWTVLNDIWSKHLHELGLIKHVTPVIAVVANSSCDLEQLPWDELRDVS